MKKELKDYVHLYIGCKMIFEKSGRISTLCGVQPDLDSGRDCLRLHDGRDWHSHDYFPYKLILRPLELMTKEEEDYMKGNFCYKGQGVTEYYTPKGMLYLLSRGFDLFGLIKAGIAVNEMYIV